ncbi:hypothetical protein ACFLZN_01735 [Nanoarchaeota archaeon]
MDESCNAKRVEVENQLRDLLNWVSVFAEEYDLPEEATHKLREKIELLAKTVGEIPCD